MTDLLGNWEAFNGAMKDSFDTFFNETLVWKRANNTVNRFGEDVDTDPTNINLPCLADYNMFRTWPVDKFEAGGKIDKESVTCILYKPWLSEHSYLNTNGYLAIDSGYDEFVLKGIRYKASGDTSISQALSTEIHFYLILSRVEILTGDNYHKDLPS